MKIFKRDPIDNITDAMMLSCFLVIIYLKIINVITISWIWILSPIWGSLLIGTILLLIVVSIHVTKYIIKKIRRNYNERNQAI